MSNFILPKGMVVFLGKCCSMCESLKRQLDSKSKTYVEFNVHENADAAEYLRGLGLRGLPVVFIDGKQARLNG